MNRILALRLVPVAFFALATVSAYPAFVSPRGEKVQYSENSWISFETGAESYLDVPTPQNPESPPRPSRIRGAVNGSAFDYAIHPTPSSDTGGVGAEFAYVSPSRVWMRHPFIHGSCWEASLFDLASGQIAINLKGAEFEISPNGAHVAYQTSEKSRWGAVAVLVDGTMLYPEVARFDEGGIVSLYDGKNPNRDRAAKIMKEMPPTFKIGPTIWRHDNAVEFAVGTAPFRLIVDKEHESTQRIVEERWDKISHFEILGLANLDKETELTVRETDVDIELFNANEFYLPRANHPASMMDTVRMKMGATRETKVKLAASKLQPLPLEKWNEEFEKRARPVNRYASEKPD